MWVRTTQLQNPIELLAFLILKMKKHEGSDHPTAEPPGLLAFLILKVKKHEGSGHPTAESLRLPEIKAIPQRKKLMG